MTVSLSSPVSPGPVSLSVCGEVCEAPGAPPEVDGDHVPLSLTHSECSQGSHEFFPLAGIKGVVRMGVGCASTGVYPLDLQLRLPGRVHGSSPKAS